MENGHQLEEAETSSTSEFPPRDAAGGNCTQKNLQEMKMWQRATRGRRTRTGYNRLMERPFPQARPIANAVITTNRTTTFQPASSPEMLHRLGTISGAIRKRTAVTASEFDGRPQVHIISLHHSKSCLSANSIPTTGSQYSSTL